MDRDWNELTRLTGGASIVVERVKLVDSGIVIEGEFALPPLAQLGAEDQLFVMSLVRTHGSLKEVGRLFNISYPTVKNRIIRLSGKLKMVEIKPQPSVGLGQEGILDRLERGEISTDEALKRLA